MDRMLCALFEDEPHAAAAIDALVNGDVGDDLVNVVMHEERVRHEDLGLAGGRSGRRMILGAAIGAAVGGLIGGGLGLWLAPAGALFSALLASVLGGAAAGAAYATLAGVIAGRDAEPPALGRLSRAFDAGNVLVTLEVHGAASVRDDARAILRRFGGRLLDAEKRTATSAVPSSTTPT
jgi:uncharacterized transporter YbjL